MSRITRPQIQAITKALKFMKDEDDKDSYELEVIPGCQIFLYYFTSRAKGESGWRIQFNGNNSPFHNHEVHRLSKPSDILLYLASFIENVTARRVRDEDFAIMNEATQEMGLTRWRSDKYIITDQVDALFD